MIMKVANHQVVMREFPDEITLALNISGCPNRCEGCHSPQLRDDIGDELNTELLDQLIQDNPGITCVGFMGGDGRENELLELAGYVRDHYDLKTGWYSGCDSFDSSMLTMFDYIKYGHYNSIKGPLNVRTTNQVFLRIRHDQGIEIHDETYRFWTMGVTNDV